MNRVRPPRVFMMSVPEAVLDVRFPVGDTTVLEPRFAPEPVPALPPVAPGVFVGLVGCFAATLGAFAFPDDLVATLLAVDSDVVVVETAVLEVADRDWPATRVAGSVMAITRRCGPTAALGTIGCLAVLARGEAPLPDFLPEKKLSQPMDETPRLSDLLPPRGLVLRSSQEAGKPLPLTSIPVTPRSAGVYLQRPMQPGFS